MITRYFKFIIGTYVPLYSVISISNLSEKGLNLSLLVYIALKKRCFLAFRCFYQEDVRIRQFWQKGRLKEGIMRKNKGPTKLWEPKKQNKRLRSYATRAHDYAARPAAVHSCTHVCVLPVREAYGCLYAEAQQCTVPTLVNKGKVQTLLKTFCLLF